MSDKKMMGKNETLRQKDEIGCEAVKDCQDDSSTASDGNILEHILANYAYRNQLMASELKIASDHAGLTGDFRESMWMSFFRSIIPLKYSLAKGVKVIDSEGQVSREVDIAVFDEQYTPYVFQYQGIKFIPIEAVVIVIECKSKDYDDKKLKCWSKRINKLNARPTGIARIATGYSVGFTSPTQIRTRPIRILATMRKYVRDKTLIDAAKELKDYFDFIIMEKEDKGHYSFEYVLNYEEKSLGWWGHWLNKGEKLGDQDTPLELQYVGKGDERTANYEELSFNDDSLLKNSVKDLRVKNNALLSLNFQLNQLLMLLNNPMLFPHYAYAKRFNKAIHDKELTDRLEQVKQNPKGRDDG
ncbi:DUF6602 domain-containing protein [Cohnella hongkongensis]|uniref:DUF6602 domain-containing protein n=1 Tax=Cohnella hongkongensis TaxID=178337 RepID=A0ABV9FJL4_9BACL